LSNPTPGVTLGTATTTVSIKGDYATVAPPFDTAVTIRREWGVNVLTWAGGGQLQRADKPTGPWQTLTTATNPCTVQSPVSTAFYRVRRPRSVTLYVPSGYDGQTNMPLVILLHGYGQTGTVVADMLQFRPLAEARGLLWCCPDGTINLWGKPFWNATDACCDFQGTGVNDADYLRSVIEEIAETFAVDRKRIYLVGVSNGGFMAYRMACQHADLIAGIASVAGMTFLGSNCQPSQPVHILHIHGTADTTVPYAGGSMGPPMFPSNLSPLPGALQSVQMWAGYNGCVGQVTDAWRSLDLDLDVPGLDTVVTRYTNCPPGGAVELWSVQGVTHSPALSAEFSPRVIDWLLAHPKP
jgi:polyhydroxybutyrate depolymerase